MSGSRIATASPTFMKLTISCHLRLSFPTDVEIHKTDSIMVLFCFMQRIPMWWIWLYYICPTSWALEGMFTSQYGDLDKEI